jgi:hypothetical protein
MGPRQFLQRQRLENGVDYQRVDHDQRAAGPERRVRAADHAETSAASGSVDELVLSCYARGISTCDTEALLFEMCGVGASWELLEHHGRGGRMGLVPRDISGRRQVAP